MRDLRLLEVEAEGKTKPMDRLDCQQIWRKFLPRDCQLHLYGTKENFRRDDHHSLGHRCLSLHSPIGTLRGNPRKNVRLDHICRSRG
jgi:hypothetical protein